MNAPSQNRSVVKDLLTVMSGTAGAQAIGLLILPVLTRSFAPEAFGVFQLYLSLLVFCTVGIALRIELTVVSTAESEMQTLMASLLGLVIVVGCIITIVLMILDVSGWALNFPAWLFGLGLIANGFIQITTYKLIRDQNFNRLAVLKFAQVGVYALVALVIAATNPTISGIIIADVTGRFAAALFGIITLRRTNNGTRPYFAHFNSIKFVQQHWKLVVVSLPGALANSGGAMLTPFMIFHVFGAAATGQYSLVDRSLGVPVAMIVGAASQVFLGRITTQIRARDFHAALAMFIKIVIASIAVAGIGAVIFRVLLPYFFAVIFGPGWETAIVIAGILVFAYAAAFVTGIVNQTLVALREFRLQSAWDFGWLAGMVAVWVLVVTLKLDLYTAITLHASVIALLGIVFIFMCLNKMRRAIAQAEKSGSEICVV